MCNMCALRPATYFNRQNCWNFPQYEHPGLCSVLVQLQILRNLHIDSFVFQSPAGILWNIHPTISPHLYRASCMEHRRTADGSNMLLPGASSLSFLLVLLQLLPELNIFQDVDF